MSSTNKTTHYDLSQYTASDKPTYLVDYNTDMSNIDQGIYDADSLARNNEQSIGTLSDLQTTAKNNLVSAINELKGKTDSIGNLSNLTTSANTDLVVAINEVDAEANLNNQNIGTMTNLETTVKTSLVGAINEVNTGKNNNATNIGNLSNLNTTDKSSLVNAINEINEFNIYSTTEQIVGKWYDDKTIYRKILTGTTSSSASFTIDTGLTNWNILPMSCMLLNGRAFAGYDGTYGYRFEKTSGNDVIVNKNPSNAWSNAPYVLVLYYTKN